jgi:hypothetical protein
MGPRVRTGLLLGTVGTYRCKMQVCFQILVETLALEHAALVGSGDRGGGGNQRRGVSVPTVLGSVLKLFSVVQALHGGL